MKNTPRQYTEEETSEKFLKTVWTILEYWHSLPKKTEQEKMSGAAFSILSMIDGCNVSLPKFILAPDPHPNDKDYYAESGRKHFAENFSANVSCDIAGSLHELFSKYQPEDWER